MNGKKGVLLWITGLPGAGKTTIGKRVYELINMDFSDTIHLDGDEMRNVWSLQNEKSIESRKKIAMSYAKQCSLLTSQGINVIMSAVSLFHEVHDYNRKNNSSYYEILVSANENALKERLGEKAYDVKEKCETEKLEFPKNPDLVLKNDTEENLRENVHKIMNLVNPRLKQINSSE